MWARCERSNQDHEESDRLEKESESLHAAAGEVTGMRLRPAQHEIDAVHRDPEHRGKTPTGDAPTGEQEHRQRQQHEHAAAERRKKMPRLRPRRGKQCTWHQNAPRYRR